MDDLLISYEDFLLHKQAQMRSKRTIENYQYVLDSFLSTLDSLPDSTDVRRYLAELASRGVKKGTVATHARAIRVFVNFLYDEEYIPKPLKVAVPNGRPDNLPVVNREELGAALEACNTFRDKAILLVFADTGIRRQELVDLTWEDLDLATGLLTIRNGKGGKSRSVVIGATTRRMLLKYRRETETTGSLFGLKAQGVRMVLRRVGERAGIHLTCHAFRRAFATWSLTNGMNPLVLQALMGHSNLRTTERYIHLLEGDLIEAHREAGPVDRLHKNCRLT